MATVLGPNAKAILHHESSAAHSTHMVMIKGNKSNTNNLVRLSATKQFDEPSAARAASIERIMSTKAS